MIIQELGVSSLDEELAKNQPDFLYEGTVPADNDRFDYIEIKLQGVRLA